MTPNISTAKPVACAMARTLRLARKTVGLTQVQLAGKIGVADSFVNKLEQGKVTPSLESLIRHGDGLGIPAWKLLRKAQRLMEESAHGD